MSTQHLQQQKLLNFHSLARLLTRLVTNSLAHSLAYLVTPHLFAHSLIQLPAYSTTHLPTYSLVTHSLAFSLTPTLIRPLILLYTHPPTHPFRPVTVYLYVSQFFCSLRDNSQHGFLWLRTQSIGPLLRRRQ